MQASNTTNPKICVFLTVYLRRDGQLLSMNASITIDNFSTSSG
jgi:hypothetical protein